jgi:HEPN domain-containing protein
METRLSAEELNSRLEEIDAVLEAQALPLKYRPLEGFKRTYGDLLDGPLRGSLFDSIADWYRDRYGKRAEPDGIIGRIPVLLRGEVYLVLVPLTEGDAVVRLIDQIDGLPTEVGASLSREEFEAIARKVAGATIGFQTLYNLTVEDGFLDAVERGLVWRALFDLETAATTLRHVGDTQNTIFQIHQAAEKFLKVALKRAGSTADLKRLGHNLPAVFAELKSLSDRYSWLESSVDALQALAPNMQIRYSVVPRRRENAIEAFHEALSICGALAQMWLFDTKRGSGNPRFLPGCFYVDGTRGTYFCKSTLQNAGAPPSAILTHFGVNPVLGRMMFDISVYLSESALYLEVKNEEELAALQRELDSFIRQPPAHRATPEELGIKTDSGPEGSYTTALLRLRS